MTNNNKILRLLFSSLAFILFDRSRSTLFCCMSVIGSFFVEMHFCIPAFFSNSGAIVSIAGLFLNIKHTLNFHLDLSKISLLNKLSGTGKWGTSNITPEQEKWVDDILADEMFGVSFMIIGTVIWAYGSYLISVIRP